MALDTSRPQSALILCITANARGYLGAALSLGGQSAALRTARLLADAADGTIPGQRLRAEVQWLLGLLQLRRGVATTRRAPIASKIEKPTKCPAISDLEIESVAGILRPNTSQGLLSRTSAGPPQPPGSLSNGPAT